MHRIIRIKNRIFETEIKFLEEKHRQGFALAKKGKFFYQFAPAEKKEAIYEIDLLPKSLTGTELEVEGFRVVHSEFGSSGNFQKVYYLSESAEKCFVVDEQLRLDYYQAGGRQYLTTVSVLSILFLALAIYGNFATHPTLEVLVPLLLLTTLVLLAFAVRIWFCFMGGASSLRKKNSEMDKSGIYYNIRFINPSNKQRVELEEKLPTLGFILSHLKKKKDDYYSLKSSIASIADLEREILNITSFRKGDIKIVRTSASGSLVLNEK